MKAQQVLVLIQTKKISPWSVGVLKFCGNDLFLCVWVCDWEGKAGGAAVG